MRHPGRLVQTLTACLLQTSLAMAAGNSDQSQEKFRKTPPLPEPLRAFRLPSIESEPLANGLVVAVAARPASPLLTIQIIFQAGEADSPVNVPGVGAVTARMIGRKTKVASAEDMANAIASMGGDFSVTVGMDYTILTLRVLGEYLDKALYTLRLMVLEPEFSDEDLIEVKRDYFYELRDREKNPEALGRRQLLRILFENHPYQLGTYTKEAVKFISLPDIQSYYDEFYRPNNAICEITGDLNLPTAVRKVGQNFAMWMKKAVVKPTLSCPQPNDKERACFIDYPGLKDATIFAGNLAMPATNPDYFSFLVLNQVLGGTTGSRLFMDLRESKSFAYYAFSEAEFFRFCGAYWAKARVPPESVYAAVQEITKELEVLSAEKAIPTEIEEAKSFLIGNLPVKFASPEGFSMKLAQVMALGLGDQHWGGFTDSLMLVNVEKVLEVARRYFPHLPVIVIVGNETWAGVALRNFNVVDIYDSNGAFKMTVRKGVER